MLLMPANDFLGSKTIFELDSDLLTRLFSLLYLLMLAVVGLTVGKCFSNYVRVYRSISVLVVQDSHMIPYILLLYVLVDWIFVVYQLAVYLLHILDIDHDDRLTSKCLQAINHTSGIFVRSFNQLI
jgi:hypothetical protein